MKEKQQHLTLEGIKKFQDELDQTIKFMYNI